MHAHFDHQIFNLHTFGLVDAAMLAALPAGINTLALVPSDLAASAHLMPRLIDFRATPNDKLNALLDCLYQAQKKQAPPPLALLVKSDLDAQAFVRRWNTQQLAVPAPGRKAWLRLHDPRVLHQLLRIMTPAQRRKLLGRSGACTYWIGGEWLSAQDHGAPLPEADTARWDWARIELIGAVNRALLRADVSQAAALASQGALAEQLISRAKSRHGLQERADLVEFVVRGLTVSVRFDEHPKIAGVIKPSSDPDEESSLSDRLALIDKHIWNELRQPVAAQQESKHA